MLYIEDLSLCGGMGEVLGWGYVKYLPVIFGLLFHLKQSQFKCLRSDHTFDVEYGFTGGLCDTMISSREDTHLAFDYTYQHGQYGVILS